MNRRERFLETMTFGKPDRAASGDYFYYDATRERWESEGLPKAADLNEYFEMDFDPFRWKIDANISIQPEYEEETVEETDEIRVVRREKGEIVRILKNVPPPAMPQWVRYPLESREEWDEYKTRLDPDTPGRLPADLSQKAAETADRDYPIGMWLGGSYGVLRDMWGVENLSYLFFDDTALIEEMIEYLTNLTVGVLDKVLATGIELDWVMFWEDMAYKTGPLVSPAQFKQYCVPFYTRVMERVRKAGIPVVMVDSDGDIRKLIPIWLDAGVNIMHPMEVAASMDVVKCREQYGKKIGFFGGIDKRALSGTRQQVKEEVMPKLEACFKDGGFIPAFDHAIPPDVSFENYCYYRELVRSFD